jgi:hypothetical protein
VLPLRRLQELSADGVVGAAAECSVWWGAAGWGVAGFEGAYELCGGVVSPRTGPAEMVKREEPAGAEDLAAAPVLDLVRNEGVRILAG